MVIRMSLLTYLAGTVTVRLPLLSKRIYTAILIKHTIPITASCAEENGDLLVTMRTSAYRVFCENLERRGLRTPEIVGRQGLPYVLACFRARPGVFVGAALMIGIVVLSSLFCWRVDVICLDNAQAVRSEDYVDTNAVRTQLADMGVGVGTFLPSLDVRMSENRFLMHSDSVSWIAINQQGTVLSVEVRSTHAVSDEGSGFLKETEDGLLEGCNLIADADGRVIRWEVQNGNVVVQNEQMVTKGMLLASGVYESKDGDVIFSRAHGKVFAETVRTLRAEIPLQVTEDHPTGTCETRSTLHFFGHDLISWRWSNVTFLEIFQNWKKKTGFSDAEYDTIIEERVMKLPDGTRLPLTVKKESRLYKTQSTRSRTKEEASALAEAALTEQLSGMTDAVVLSAETDTVWEEDRLIVTRHIYCIDNIAVPQNYYVDSKGS